MNVVPWRKAGRDRPPTHTSSVAYSSALPGGEVDAVLSGDDSLQRRLQEATPELAGDGLERRRSGGWCEKGSSTASGLYVKSGSGAPG